MRVFIFSAIVHFCFAYLLHNMYYMLCGTRTASVLFQAASIVELDREIENATWRLGLLAACDCSTGSRGFVCIMTMGSASHSGVVQMTHFHRSGEEVHVNLAQYAFWPACSVANDCVEPVTHCFAFVLGQCSYSALSATSQLGGGLSRTELGKSVSFVESTCV